MDLAQAEAVADVIASQSEASHKVAMNQLKGGYSNELKSLREELLKMTSFSNWNLISAKKTWNSPTESNSGH